MVTISCTGQSEARGRNRWCRLAEAEITLFHHGHADEARLCLDLFSCRRGRSAPVILLLTAADATALAQALQGAVQQLTAILRGSDGTRGMAVDTDHPAVLHDVSRRTRPGPRGQASTTEAPPPHRHRSTGGTSPRRAGAEGAHDEPLYDCAP